jgi:hypothetical protein
MALVAEANETLQEATSRRTQRAEEQGHSYQSLQENLTPVRDLCNAQNILKN